MTLLQEGLLHYRRFFWAFPEVSLYVITAVTLYYNEFSSQNMPIYHLLSQFFGSSVVALFGWFIAGAFIGFGRRQWASMLGLLVYVLFNIGYSVEWMQYNTTFAEVYPTLETVSTCIFSIFVSSLYIPAWDARISKLRDKWMRL